MQITLTFVILFIALLAQSGCDDNKSSVPNFWHYQQTWEFKEIVKEQINATWPFNETTNILAISDFDYDGDHVVSQYAISEGGNGRSWRNAINHAIQPGKNIKQSLSEAEFEGVKSAIKELPLNNYNPPLKRLVIVSFKSDTNWVTHSYDRKSLPQAMLKICDIAGLGIEMQK